MILSGVFRVIFSQQQLAQGTKVSVSRARFWEILQNNEDEKLSEFWNRQEGLERNFFSRWVPCDAAATKAKHLGMTKCMWEESLTCLQLLFVTVECMRPWYIFLWLWYGKSFRQKTLGNDCFLQSLWLWIFMAVNLHAYEREEGLLCSTGSTATASWSLAS